MKRKWALVLCLAVLSALCFAGGSKDASEGGKATEVIFWHSMSGDMGKTLEKIVNDYNESQDKVVVVPQFQGNYYDMASKLQIGVTSGDVPHVAQLEMGRTKMFADYGILVDMTDIAKKAGFDLDMFYEGLMSCLDWGEGVYAIPFNRSTPMFYYNKDMFKEVGLDPDDPPENWEELHEYAKRLSIPDERWGFEMPIDAWFYEAFIMQSNGQILNADETDIGFNNYTGTAPLELWRAMVADGSMKTPPGKEYNSYEAARSDFSAGLSGMIITSSGDLGMLRKNCPFEVGTAFLPGNERYAVPTGGANVIMLEGHEKDEMATIDFLKYLSSPDVAAYWSTQTGYVPSSQAAADSAVYKDYLENVPAGRRSLEQMAYTDIPRPVNVNYPEIHAEIMMTEIQRCMEVPSFTPEMAVQAISDQTRALLAK